MTVFFSTTPHPSSQEEGTTGCLLLVPTCENNKKIPGVIPTTGIILLLSLKWYAAVPPDVLQIPSTGTCGD